MRGMASCNFRLYTVVLLCSLYTRDLILLPPDLIILWHLFYFPKKNIQKVFFFHPSTCSAVYKSFTNPAHIYTCCNEPYAHCQIKFLPRILVANKHNLSQDPSTKRWIWSRFEAGAKRVLVITRTHIDPSLIQFLDGRYFQFLNFYY